MADSKIIVLRPDSPADLNTSLATISDGGAVTTIDYIGIKDGNTLNKTLTLGINPNQTNQIFSLTMPASPGTAGQVLAIDSSGVDYAILKFANNGGGGSGGTVTSITAGTGLTGGTITESGTIEIANTAVTAGSYTNANITVGADGRITSASNGNGGGIVASGTATLALDSGAVFPSFTINNLLITTNSTIILTRIGAITNAATIGELTISSQTAGSFTVQSTVGTDIGQIKWTVIN